MRDPADGKFYLCRLLVCRYETDCSFVEKETNDIEDLHHANVVRIGFGNFNICQIWSEIFVKFQIN